MSAHWNGDRNDSHSRRIVAAPPVAVKQRNGSSQDDAMGMAFTIITDPSGSRTHHDCPTRLGDGRLLDLHPDTPVVENPDKSQSYFPIFALVATDTTAFANQLRQSGDFKKALAESTSVMDEAHTSPSLGASATAPILSSEAQTAVPAVAADPSSEAASGDSIVQRTRTPSTGSKSSGTGSKAPASESKDLENGPKDKIKDPEKHETNDAAQDPNIVDWDGPDDPEKGVNWPAAKKWTIIAALSFLTFISPLASSMFAPAVPEVIMEFGTTDNYIEGFVVSVYILGYATGPIVIAPLSELYGRNIIYHSTNLLFVVFNVACALSTSMGMLIAFRFLAGAAGSAVLTMGAGTMFDLFIQEERGRAMSIWASGPLLGPVIGPIAGGFLGNAKGWRWIFWVIAIAAGACTLLMFAVLKESYGHIILKRKAARLRKETGNPHLRSALDKGLSPSAEFSRAIFRPLKMLLFSPIVLLLTLYNSVVYGYLYLLFTTITVVFEQGYGFNGGIVGLVFLGIGIGMFSGMIVFSMISDAIVKRKAGPGGVMKPEYRLPPMGASGLVVPIGLFIYGWTAQYQVFWFWPIFGTAWLGFGLLGVFMCISNYLVDAYTIYAASAMAANTIVRSLFGAFLPLAGPSLYQALGLGWGNSLLGFIAVAMTPIPWLFMKYGERIRTSPRFRPNW